MPATQALRNALLGADVDALVVMCVEIDRTPRGAGESPGSIVFCSPKCPTAQELLRLDDTAVDVLASDVKDAACRRFAALAGLRCTPKV
jgi:hypothetical protein